ncbi:Nucleolar protein 10 [Halocaridina rubra]|uniref:Nucleolar protein 10 n=1 Tax=Halocaridina rubra TaxID=373956 RepID=A0AAN8ZZE9_HALRR
MKALEGRNNVKVYNLSAGKSLPDWLTNRKKRQLSKRDVDIRRRIELLQDFSMPDISNCIRCTPDGRCVIATGTYKPRVRCYEVAALSLKFERGLDSEVVQFDILSDDYSKLVFLQDDRYVEFHYKGGRWFRTRIPKFGRDLAYHYPSCDLYICASGSEIYRVNLNQGRFLNSLQTDAPGINKCEFNRVHYMFACGTEDGRIEAWDPRSRHRIGILDCAMHMSTDNIQSQSYTSAKKYGITALAFNDALTLGVGTQTGQVLLYDIRSDKPMLVKDHYDGFPITDLEFHSSSRMVLSMSPKVVKIWDKENGSPHTSIESTVDFNDLCVVPNSGMIFLATEDTKMQSYFLPSLGPAPKWCAHLDALIEELEEEDIPTQYDDYKFVTAEELKQLGLEDLIGSNVLRAVMHGYYMDARLYSKAKLIANPFNYDEFMKRKLRQKILEQNQRGIKKKNLPSVNTELYERLLEDKNEGIKKRRVENAQSLLEDDRFGDLFANADFQIDKESETFRLVNPTLNRMSKLKQKQKQLEEAEELEDLRARDGLGSPESSDSDSIFSESEDESEMQNINTENEQNDKLKKKKEDIKSKNKSSKMGTKQSDGDKMEDDTKEQDRSDKLNFTAADSLSDLKAKKKKLSKMSLADRLNMEDHSADSVKHHTFGSREMSYVVKERRNADRYKQQKEEHFRERKQLQRSASKLKGKFRINAPM